MRLQTDSHRTGRLGSKHPVHDMNFTSNAFLSRIGFDIGLKIVNVQLNYERGIQGNSRKFRHSDRRREKGKCTERYIQNNKLQIHKVFRGVSSGSREFHERGGDICTAAVH